MANNVKGYHEIMLDKPRKLRYDMTALAEIEEKLNRPLHSVLQQEMGIREVRTFLWAGLLWKHPEITPAEAGHLVGPENIDRVTREVAKAIATSFPSKKKGKGKDGTDAADPLAGEVETEELDGGIE